jgi:SAM-dependent methyltransferase
MFRAIASRHSGIKAGLTRLAHHARNPMALPALIWKNISYPFTAQGAEDRYDRQLGIDTGGYIEPADLDLSPEEARRGKPYGATPPLVARHLIELVAARAGEFTFIDVGSGKGRVLMIAAEYPFRRVIGLEHSRLLNDIAAENLHRFRSAHPQAAPITLVTGDAAQLTLPNEPLVLFLFNSLGAEAVTEFAAAVKSSYLQAPRKIVVIYYNTGHPDAFDEIGIFPTRYAVDYPRDPCDRYKSYNFQALVFET